MRGRVYRWLTLLILMVVSLSACNSHTDRPPDPQKSISNGKPLYEQHCATCHQKDGKGQPGKVPKLAGNPIITLEDPIPIITTVVNGQGKMPEFGDKLSSNEIADILSYIRNAWGNQAPAVSNRQVP